MNDKILVKEGREASFSLGVTEVVSPRSLLLPKDVELMGEYYEPPISLDIIYVLQFSAPHHSSSLQVKANVLSLTAETNDVLSSEELQKAIYDYLVFGNCYFEIIKSRGGGLVELKHMPAMYVRRGLKIDEFYWLDKQTSNPTKLRTGSILHLKNYDPRQEIYGVPAYLSGLSSMLLNAQSTIFRRKYYSNGSHMGHIYYLRNSHLTDEDLTALEEQISSSKGPGNFRNLFLHLPDAKDGDFQLIPVGAQIAKDEFLEIKNITRDDIMATHRVPPNIMGLVPDGKANFGNTATATIVFHKNEIIPLQKKFSQLNELLNIKIIKWNEYFVPNAGVPEDKGKS